jgi:acyl carrier protein
MLEKIANIIKDYKGDESFEVSEATTFEEIGLDSLDIAQLVMDVEDAFNVTIEMDGKIKDVAALMNVIENSKG